MQELNGLELEFLSRLGFDLFVQREEYDWYAGHLLEQEAVRRPTAQQPHRCAPAAAGPAPGPDCPASPETAGGCGPRDAEDSAAMDDVEAGVSEDTGPMDAEEGVGAAAGRSMEEVGKVQSFCDIAAATAAGFLRPA